MDIKVDLSSLYGGHHDDLGMLWLVARVLLFAFQVIQNFFLCVAKLF